MQRAAGLTDVRWLDAAEAARREPDARSGDVPRRHVRAGRRVHRSAAQRARVLARDAARRRRRSASARRSSASRTSADGALTGVETPDGTIATERLLLTGGPTLRAVGALVGARFFVGAVRHQVAVTRAARGVRRRTAADGVRHRVGLYWRLEEGGLPVGMSNPDEAPGKAREVDWPYLHKMQERLRRLRPGDDGPRDPEGVGGDDRVLPGPPSDPRTGRHDAPATRSRA